MHAHEPKTCLVLSSAQLPETHLALFKRLGNTFDFELCAVAEYPDLAQAILSASFIIADLSGNDARVLYSLGVAHTFGKRVFLVTDRFDNVPFDLASTRVWVIDASENNAEIVQAMQQFLKVRQVIGPVRLFLGKYAFFGESLIFRRLGAFAVDALLFLSMVALYVLFKELGPDSSLSGKIAYLLNPVSAPPGSEPGMTILVVTMYALIGYFILSTWVLEATLGQWLNGLKVLQTDYRHVTFAQSVGRSLLTFLVVMSYGAAFLSALRGPGYRAVHDILSGTIVVRRDPL